MKVETKKPQPSEFRQDLLRGIRWGTILLIAMLLTIAGYRVLSSTPATASEPKQGVDIAAVPEAAPAEASPDATIEVGTAAPKQEVLLTGPDAPAAPPLVKARKPVVTAAVTATHPQVVEPPTRIRAPRFNSANSSPVLPAVASGRATVVTPFAEPLPAVDTPAPAVDLPNPRNPELAPPPTDNSKQGNRATRAVRSVGRLFRIGKKENEAKQGDASK
jgi:hypothetical protein